MAGNTGTQDISEIITMGSVSNPTPVTGQVWWDGTHLQMNIGGTTYQLDHPKSSAWTISGVSANRTYNPSTASNAQTAQALGTLLMDLQTTIALLG